ncbi:hypothetical protein EMPS_04240 [Entomortierella parvispora]|uniref:Uncharacterized protein n=1 Tax=Entomortierella parvispora TaxID=205924 RepID=A0A9P3H8B6_9FUNG|nr:hypothetical protein EMPS_04240 [Entomortierella parvispora]
MRSLSSVRLFLCSLLSIALILSTYTSALPTPARSKLEHIDPFTFTVNSPTIRSQWLVNTLPIISWDPSSMPVGSTLDIQLLSHDQKSSVYLSRYVPAGSGSVRVNLRPDFIPGTYTLRLIVYKGRSTTILGRSTVHPLRIMVESDVSENDNTPSSPETSSPSISTPSLSTTLASRKQSRHILASADKSETKLELQNRFYFTKESRDAVLESEPVSVDYSSSSSSMVLMAPYTIRWQLPVALQDVSEEEAKVNILVMVRDKDTQKMPEVAAVLAANVSAKAGFELLFLPRDLSPTKWYYIQVEVFGRGRKFIGRTQAFKTRSSALTMAYTDA